MRLEPLLVPEQCLMLSSIADRAALFEAIAHAGSQCLPAESVTRLVEVLEEREGQYPTSTPEGVAFPHAMIGNIDQTVLIPVLVTPGIDFGVKGHPPCDIVFGIFGAESKAYQHVQLLARLARVVRAPGALDRLRACNSAENLHAVLLDEDSSHG